MKGGKNKKTKDDYIVLFQGIKLSKQQANKVGLAIIMGIIGLLVSSFLIDVRNRVIELILIFCFVLFGYFWLGNKLFKN